MKMIFKVLIIVLVCAILSGCGGGQKTITGEKISDKELTSQSDRQKTELLKQLDKKYADAKTHYELGRLYHSEGQWDKAEWEYNKTLAFEPIHHDAQASIAKLLVDKGDTQRGEVIADMYMSQASVSAKHSLLLGRAFQARGLEEYALSCYLQAHRLAPNSVVINKQLGNFYLMKGDRPNAEMYLRRAFELDPYQPEVAGQLGRLGVQVQMPRKMPKEAKNIDKMKEPKGQEGLK
ncbi:MAG: tetratricopeptide repeat protein [Planctomycetes bacterium]|nr:tetratricopeptide repeat protein [Planctomycetota bacterium]MBU1518726.1 tetratricopeptide repeat protein [Planctomycetota bacterium]MBU2457621.1 tetratricopeptide repeat protein [Planctomycetota bacterium]MBU2596787.1 tetratricopeptide repeat protein [Planctomycetota bacterium]